MLRKVPTADRISSQAVVAGCRYASGSTSRDRKPMVWSRVGEHRVRPLAGSTWRLTKRFATLPWYAVSLADACMSIYLRRRPVEQRASASTLALQELASYVASWQIAGTGGSGMVCMRATLRAFVVCRACAPNDSAVCVWEGYPPAFGRVEAEVARYT